MKSKIIRDYKDRACMDEICMLLMRDLSAEDNDIDMSDYLYMTILFKLDEMIFRIPAKDNWTRYFVLSNGDVTWLYDCNSLDMDKCDAVYKIKGTSERIILVKFWKEK